MLGDAQVFTKENKAGLSSRQEQAAAWFATSKSRQQDAWNIQKKGIQTCVAPEAAQESGTAQCRIPLVAVCPP